MMAASTEAEAVRALEIPSFIIRITESMLCSVHRGSLLEAVGKEQHCLAKEAAASILFAAKLDFSRRTPGGPQRGIGTTDWKNGYGTCLRAKGVAHLLASGATGPVPYLFSSYSASKSPQSVFHMANGTPVVFEGSGVGQGKPTSSVVYAACVAEASADAAAHFPDTTISTFVDDSTFGGTHADMAKLYHHVGDPEGLYAKAQQVPAKGKSKVWFPELLTQEERDCYPDWVTIVPPHEGIYVMGVPFGHDDWVKKQLLARVHEKLAVLKGAAFARMSTQNRNQLLRSVFNSRIDHFSRVLPARLVGEANQEWDRTVQETVARELLGMSVGDIPPEAWIRLRLPMVKAGAGITAKVHTQSAAHLGAWLQSVDLVVERFPHLSEAAEAVSRAAAAACTFKEGRKQQQQQGEGQEQQQQAASPQEVEAIAPDPGRAERGGGRSRRAATLRMRWPVLTRTRRTPAAGRRRGRCTGLLPPPCCSSPPPRPAMRSPPATPACFARALSSRGRTASRQYSPSAWSLQARRTASSSALAGSAAAATRPSRRASRA